MNDEMSKKEKACMWLNIIIITGSFGFYAYATLFFGFGWWMN